MKHSAPGPADHDMLAARFVTGPHVLAPDKAEQIFGGWLEDLAPEQSDALAALTDHPFARAILLGLAEFSPYLFDLIRDDPGRLIRLLRSDPEAHLAALIETTSQEGVAGVLIGVVLGMLIAQNLYVYHSLDGDDVVPSLVNQQGWEPLGGGPDGNEFYRRPRFHIG